MKGEEVGYPLLSLREAISAEIAARNPTRSMRSRDSLLRRRSRLAAIKKGRSSQSSTVHSNRFKTPSNVLAASLVPVANDVVVAVVAAVSIRANGGVAEDQEAVAQTIRS